MLTVGVVGVNAVDGWRKAGPLDSALYWANSKPQIFAEGTRVPSRPGHDSLQQNLVFVVCSPVSC